MAKRSPIAMIVDRVMHYHRPTLQAIEARLAEQDIELHVLSSRDRAGAVGRVAEAKPVVRLHQHYSLREMQVRGFTLRAQLGLADMIRAIRPSVVVSTCHSGTVTEWQILRDSARRGARSVAWQCGYEYHPGWLKDQVLGRFVPMFDMHLCYHSNARNYALRHGATLAQTLVMHNTIDERSIVPTNADAAREQLVIKHPQLANRKIILYVGAVLAEKRLELVFDALDRLNDPQAFFLIVGDGAHLSSLRQRYGHRLDWLAVGQVVQGVGVYFDGGHVFVLPGTGGLAINEAMAHRLPVISGYADGSADDLVLDEETGFRLRDSSADELAARLRRVLSDVEFATALGKRGEQRIRGELSFERFVDRAVNGLLGEHRLATQRN